MYRQVFDLISLQFDFWCPDFFISANITVRRLCSSFLSIKEAAIKRAHRQSLSCLQIWSINILHPVVNVCEVLRCSLGCNCNISLLTGQYSRYSNWKRMLINDSQLVIYIFFWTRVQVTTQRSSVKIVIYWECLLTDDIISDKLKISDWEKNTCPWAC